MRRSATSKGRCPTGNRRPPGGQGVFEPDCITAVSVARLSSSAAGTVPPLGASRLVVYCVQNVIVGCKSRFGVGLGTTSR
jgi:hypothetical protein